MKIIKTLTVFYITIVILSSCKVSNKYEVEGKVYKSGLPMKDVLVEINGKTAFSSETGYFEIGDIPEGDHILKLSKDVGDEFADQTGAFVSKSFNISVYNDTDLGNLTLPKAVKLFEIYNETQKVKLGWTQSKDENFREYKLFRHHSSGLDETTGELIHVSTTFSNTVFIDDHSMCPSCEYYYRVYAMNDLGKLGGSNIVSVNVDNGYEELSGYLFEETNRIGVPLANPTGIASDQNNLWLMFEVSQFEEHQLIYYNPDEAKILKTLTFTDLVDNPGGAGVGGIAWDGDNIWISMAGNTNKIVKIDTSTGSELQTWSIPTVLGPTDLDWDGENLWISSGTGEIYSCNVNNGAVDLLTRINNSMHESYSRDQGITIIQDQVFIGDLFSNDIHFFDKTNGSHLAFMKNALYQNGVFCMHKNQFTVINEFGIQFYDFRKLDIK